MNASTVKSALLSLALLGGALTMNATGSVSLSEMTAADIISMIPSAGCSRENSGKEAEAIQVSGHDLLTKAYGTIEAVNSSAGTIDLSETVMNMTPVREENCLWLDSADGYNIEYNGMTPDVSALVRLENDSISDYGFFFLFPYSESLDQRDFSLSLLEDFEKMGIDLGANAYTSDLFEVSGDYIDNYMAMRLIDDSEGERLILLLSVEPNAITAADRQGAE
ncbi:MAG: hypothetical protein K2J70_08070 [Muribaculaceae bacterium]|nr:hypothetical protein [Muribaculaceae bacterium]